MKKQFSGSFEFKAVEYDYAAVIYSDDDAYIYPDEITDLDRFDRKSIDDDREKGQSRNLVIRRSSLPHSATKKY